ncbi:MAG: S41 family peptidase [Roseiflexaceae bacterium]
MSHKNSVPHNSTYSTTMSRRTLWWWISLGLIALSVSACGLIDPPAPTSTREPHIIPTLTPLIVDTPNPSPTIQPTPTLGTLNLAPTPTLSALNEDERLAIFNQVWQYVDERYVYDDYRGVDWQNVKETYRPRVIATSNINAFYLIIKEMVALLNDDHTRFDTPQEAAMDEAFFSGTADYAGIGIIIREVEQGLLIMRLAQSGPAEMAGIQPYDIVTSVDGVDISAMIRDDVEYTRRIRGPIGSQITLGILRDDQPLEIQITRNAIPSTAFPEAFTQPLLQADVTYLTIDSFNRQNLDALVKEALDSPYIVSKPKAIIIDIRENYGGSIGSMLDVMALFHDGGIMGEQVGRDQTYQLEVPNNRVLPAYANTPLIIMTSGETASAAEMFASGLRSLRGATIIGETTAGNTENLYPYDLADGSTLWLAELLFRQNDGTYIDDIGVKPDIVVDAEWGTFKPASDPFIIQALAELAQ